MASNHMPPAQHDKPLFIASHWIRAIDARDAEVMRALAIAYGDSSLVSDRLPLLYAVLTDFLARFGDMPVRILRCPGRINLRGMHVDTHGGFINLMTHQREAVIVSAITSKNESVVANINPGFPDVQIAISPWREELAASDSWGAFIAGDGARDRVSMRRGEWSNYVEGAMLRAQYEWPEVQVPGLCAMVGSDIPSGASLSSSTAISLAMFMTAASWMGCEGGILTHIRAAQDIEWFAGARIGTSDQSGMLLPRANQLVNFAPPLEAEAPRTTFFPDDLRVLVIDSHTKRNLSGAEQLNYTRNRFAYSIALEILRHEMVNEGVAPDVVAAMTRLSDFSNMRMAPFGGAATLCRWLLRVPESVSIETLRQRYPTDLVDAAYETYFGPLPELERPVSFDIRGPLLFGIAESERAREFFDAISRGDGMRAGTLMSNGHDGDRRFDGKGEPFEVDRAYAKLHALAETGGSIEDLPGVYGASSRALDALVDCAMSAGALGASLTGAGIAGTALALCNAERADAVATSLRRFIGSPKYAEIVPRAASLAPVLVEGSVVENRAVAGACEICPR
ncbi:MAG TPA: galactokinase family protein [Candidatus Hydrogenedentes bacterium]|nr:galactokinase family protein [Candidatus Hydrogenedentota bacterium]